MPHQNDRFIKQARADYVGTPKRIAWHTDQYGERHVVIEMKLTDGTAHYLDWIGAEYADQPDEFGDEVPFPHLKWAYVPEAKEA